VSIAPVSMAPVSIAPVSLAAALFVNFHVTCCKRAKTSVYLLCYSPQVLGEPKFFQFYGISHAPVREKSTVKFCRQDKVTIKDPLQTVNLKGNRN
jgi:hypothetical protein